MGVRLREKLKQLNLEVREVWRGTNAYVERVPEFNDRGEKGDSH